MRPEPRDIVEIAGVARPSAPPEPAVRTGRAWLSVWFNCCATYARIYKTADGFRYEGRCPRCGGKVRALVGPGGTSRRMFETR